MKRLENKVALVTGGASGIGKAIVARFVKEGAKVVFTDLNETLGKQVEAEIGADSYFIKADAASPSDNEMIVKETVAKFGALHIAVNNAGIGGEANIVGEMSIEGWEKNN